MTEAKQCCDKEEIPSGTDVTGCRMTTADRGPQICFLLFFFHDYIALSILLCSASPAAINLSEKQNKNMTKTCLKYK